MWERGRAIEGVVAFRREEEVSSGLEAVFFLWQAGYEGYDRDRRVAGIRVT